MAKKDNKPELQQARVLGGFTLDGIEYRPDDIIESSPELIASLGSSVDADQAAVNHCLKMENPIIKRHQHESKHAEPETPEEKPEEPEE